MRRAPAPTSCACTVSELGYLAPAMFRLELDPTDTSPRLAVVAMDRPGEKVNTFAPHDLESVEGMFDAIEHEPAIAGIVIVSRKPDNFAAGADVEVFARTKDRRDLEAFVRAAHRVLARIEASKLVTVAAIHGSCVGGGLELTLACHHRIATDAPSTVLGLPEVTLGLFPGGGGLARLPRLIGLREALDLVLTGKRVRPGEALRLGLVDQVVAPEALLAAAREAVSRLASGSMARHRAPRADFARAALERNPIGRKLLFRQARKRVYARTHGLYPAPLVALDLLERGARLPLAKALELEPPAFAELAVGETSRALVSLFLRSNALSKRNVKDAAGTPVKARALSRLGLLGGGFMGADVACVAAEKGLDTRIREIAPDALANTFARIDLYFRERARSLGERQVFKARARISGGLDLGGFETMDLVIEAVPEQLALKQAVFAELDAMVPNTTILASNTSALPIAAIGERMRRRERLVGLHFFSPVRKMQLLEIVAAPETAPETLATCLAFAVSIGKTPIVVKDGPGFYTTRVLGFYLMAAVALIEKGYSIEDIDRGAKAVGWPVGPIALLDEIGIDVASKAANTLAGAFPERMKMSAGVQTFIEHKRLGRKAGKGFYVYPPNERKRVDPSVYALFSGRPTTSPKVSPDELGERLTMIAALEAIRCLEEGVLGDADDGDVGAVFGLGYPPMRGGPFRHFDLVGLSTLVNRLASLRERFGDAYRAPQLLTQLASEGTCFADVPRKH